MKVLVIGGGGREHCLIWKIAQSPRVDKIYCAPGNGGTALLAENVEISPTETSRLLEFALRENIDLTVVGPEAPLVEGIVDIFRENGLKIFGPEKKLALLEGSKVFTKEILRKYNIPTANFRVFEDPSTAKAYIQQKNAPLVVKADGLAAGKGVIVCDSIQQALGAVDLIMVDRVFGPAGAKIIIEDFLRGEEVSLLAFSDGETILPLVASQDHKRALDGDQGLNTGGMGAYSPAPVVTSADVDRIIKTVFTPLIRGLKQEGKVYTGILYAGLMIKDNQPFVLEFNVRFGDPETQAILPKLKSDLVDVMLKTTEGRLGKTHLEWDEQFCLCVVLASGGYPSDYEKGKEISGLENLDQNPDVLVFHAGTKLVDSSAASGRRFVTSGGRVLNVVALGPTLKTAQDRAYKAIESIKFDQMHYRRDIGSKALSKALL